MSGITTPMNFEVVRDALETILLANQGALFRTVTGQRQSTDEKEIKGVLRLMQVFYSEGDYDRGRSSNAKLEHDTKFTLWYSLSSPATADLTILDDPLATPSQKQAALLASTDGSRLADQSMDEFRRMVTQILMDPVNLDLGLARYTLSNRWLRGFRKGQPIDKGNLITITATEDFECRVTETLAGATPTLGVQPVIDVTSDQRPIIDDATVSPSVGMETEQ